MVDLFIHVAFYRLRESERDNKTNQLQNGSCGGKGEARGNQRAHALCTELSACADRKAHQLGIGEQGKQNRARQTARAMEAPNIEGIPAVSNGGRS